MGCFYVYSEKLILFSSQGEGKLAFWLGEEALAKVPVIGIGE